MAAVTPAEWTLPALRVDVDGDWWDGDVQITHPGVDQSFLIHAVWRHRPS